MADILFLMRMPMDGQDNLYAKFEGQIRAARRLGHRADTIAWDDAGMWLCTAEAEPQLLLRSRFSRIWIVSRAVISFSSYVQIRFGCPPSGNPFFSILFHFLEIIRRNRQVKGCNILPNSA